MAVWKFAPTSRQVIADTADFAFDLGLYIVNDLPVTLSSSTSVTYQGNLSIVVPSAEFAFNLKGSGLTVADGILTGGTITSLSLKIGGANYVTVTGLSLSAEQFGDLALPNFDSTVLLEQFLLSGNDNITATGLNDDIRGMAGNDVLNGLAGRDELDGGAGKDVLRGGGGDDQLTGGAGADKFVFDKSVYGAGTDFISDFGGTDLMILDNDAFKGVGGPGKLSSKLFKNMDTGRIDANDRILYSQVSGGVYYDPDGNGLKPMVLFAFLDNNFRLTAGDIQIIN
ncbi:calcium-binding protein [Neogemmobacter tilapiae]|uniref:Calcium-binding protein n=1 Tax=Neogemmobacter tilapiae TaxID=875041 RepID=A0A918WNG0_9RHOB|nr:calcium-binding protein [Gemmobacter tilapiae]GHC61511.1 hypothetical protein GCM10007315_26940 [Gemmobacter tilapiae]